MRRDFFVEQLAVPGLTEKTDKVWTLPEYVDWLYEKLGGDSAPILIGHSNGGRIALAFAAKYPGRLKTLILIDSAGIRRNELPIRLKRFVFGLAAKIGKKLTRCETFRNLLYRLARESDYKNASPLMRETMANVISVDLTDQISKIKTPTLIIWGDNDRMTPLSDGKLMHKLIQTSTLHIITGTGHSPHFTHAPEVAKKIAEICNASLITKLISKAPL